MEPMYLAELNVIPMSCLFFKLPESECGRDDVAIAIEYVRSDMEQHKVHCWAWAQVGGAFLRGLVDEYNVPYSADEDKLIEKIVHTLNNSERFRKSLPGFIASVLPLDPGINEHETGM